MIMPVIVERALEEVLDVYLWNVVAGKNITEPAQPFYFTDLEDVRIVRSIENYLNRKKN